MLNVALTEEDATRIARALYEHLAGQKKAFANARRIGPSCFQPEDFGIPHIEALIERFTD